MQANETFRALAGYPAMGVKLTSARLEIAQVRWWQVKGFEKFLIFYRPRPDGVAIVRVLDAAQDWWHFLGMVGSEEEGSDLSKSKVRS